MKEKIMGNLILSTHSPACTYPCKILVTYIFTNSRPPGAMAGYIDWIMDGHISELIVQGKIKGILRESLLMVTGKKIKASMSLIIGAGDPQKMTLKRIRGIGRHTGSALNDLKISYLGLYPHDLFLPHLNRFLVLTELIEGLKGSISNNVMAGLLSNNREEKDFIDQWLYPENYENYHIFRRAWQSGGPSGCTGYNREIC